MAETVEYVVRIVGLGGDDEDKNKKTDALSSGLKGLQKSMHPIQNALKHQKGESAKAAVGKEFAKNVINTTELLVVNSINRYFVMSEDYKNQNYLNNVMSNINKVKSFGGSMITGAIAGSAGGPIGAIAGAALGGLASYTKMKVEYNNTLRSYKASLNATRVETSFRAERAGLYDGGKGTEN